MRITYWTWVIGVYTTSSTSEKVRNIKDSFKTDSWFAIGVKVISSVEDLSPELKSTQTKINPASLHYPSQGLTI